MKYQVLTLGVTYELSQLLKKFFYKYKAVLIDTVTISAALQLLNENIFHLIVMDYYAIKTENAISFVSNLRKTKVTPILILTKHLDDTGAIQILDIGADACLSRNSTPLLIFTQAQALLRRYTEYNHSDSPVYAETAPFQRGDIFIDPARQKVEICGRPVNLRNREFSLLLYFMRNPGIVLTAGQICENAWGMDYTQPIDRAIHELRKQIEANPRRPCYIKTVHRVGYCFTSYSSETCER